MRLPLPRSLHMRIMAGMAVLQLCAVGLFSFYMLTQLMSNEVTNRQALGHKILALAGTSVESLIAQHNLPGLQQYMSRVAADEAISSVTVKDAQGGVLYRQTKNTQPQHLVTRLLQNGEKPEVAVELRSDGVPLGLMTVRLSSELLNQNIDALLYNVMYLVMILLAVDLVASALLIKYLVAPLGPLASMARDISMGNLDTIMPASESASEEMRHLSTAFVGSAKLMRKQIVALEETRALISQNELRLRNLVNNIHEVLLELDDLGNVAFLNKTWTELTGHTLESSLRQPFSTFLVQPAQQAQFSPGMLSQMGESALQLEVRASDGRSLWMQMNASPQYDDRGKFAGLISTLVDINENRQVQRLQQEYQERLYRQSITDPMTGVYNRRHFDDLLDNLLELNLAKGRQVALVIIDIDGFKFINDTYGHPVGDEVLKLIAKALTTGKHQGGAVARIAGDEFAVILQNVTDEQATNVAKQIHRNIGETVINLAVGQLQVQASLGVAVAPGHGKTRQDLMRAADVALYHAKKSGRNRVDTLSRDVGDAIMDIFSQGFELRNALAGGMIAPFLQPIIELSTGEVFAYEVLTRLKRGDEYVVAENFVTIAEDLGLIRDMDLFIIKQALNLTPKGVHLFLNISLNSFYAPEFSRQLRQVLLSPAAHGHAITIEFTERQTTHMSDDFLRFFDELRTAGCKIALDDFGVGYSTYGYLRQLRPEFIKIDGSFVQQLLGNQQDAKIVEQIKELSDIFEASSIAEHVENEETSKRLLEMGVKYGQGYYFGRPKHVLDCFGKKDVKLA
jgi:diguanylate cyclase (GGDEF)-like protein/PAS domain S-box-containing protein